MRVALFSPFSQGPLRGNIITVQRIAQHLPEAGWTPMIIPLDAVDATQVQTTIDRFRPDLLHAFHAFYSGPATREQALQHGLPYLITMTGSDLHDPELSHHPSALQAVADAAAVICFDTAAAAGLTRAFPALAERVAIIPQGVAPLRCDRPFPRPTDSFIILLPAALRPVKGVLEALTALAPLAAELPQLKLWIAGDAIDQQYADLVRQHAARLPWVELLGEVPHERMGDLLAACDLVLNNSLFEGGMANTLLEAMAAARPVIARDVPGNRSLIRQGETGWLFYNPTDLRGLLRGLIGNDTALRPIGQAARESVIHRFSAHHEAHALATLYAKILQKHR